MLAVTDPLIHKTLMSVQEDPTTGIRIRTDHVAAFPALNLVYEHWSEFIGYIVFEAQTKRPYNFAAMLSKKHLREPVTEFTVLGLLNFYKAARTPS